MYLSDIPRPSSAPPERSKELILPKQAISNFRGGSLPYGEIFRPKELKQEDQKFRGFCRDQNRGPSIIAPPGIETQREESPVESQHSPTDISRRGQQSTNVTTQPSGATSRALPDEPHSPTYLGHSRSSSQTPSRLLPEALISGVTVPSNSDHRHQTSTREIPLQALPSRGSIALHPTVNSVPQSTIAHSSVPQNQTQMTQGNGRQSQSHGGTNLNNFQPGTNWNGFHHKPFKAYEFSASNSLLPPPVTWTRRSRNTIVPLLPPPGPWRWVFLSVFFGFVAIVPTFAIRESNRPPLVISNSVIVADVPPTDALLASDSFDVKDSVLGTYFSPPAEKPQSFMVYGASMGRICIRNRLNNTWSSSAKCVENAHPKLGTFSIVDWLGGPTVACQFPNSFILDSLRGRR